MSRLDFDRRMSDAEGLMWRLNAKVMNASFNIGGKGRISSTFRTALFQYGEPSDQSKILGTTSTGITF